MKKNRTMRLAVVLLALTLITTCFVSGTFAKYISSTSGSSAATVAKWSFKVNGTEFATEQATVLDFNLFDTINDTGNTADEEDVADELIAPGTAGSFKMEIKNESEVTAKWTVTLTESNPSNIPLQYSVDGTAWVDSVAELNMAALTANEIAQGVTEEVTVYWRWVFEGGADAHDGQTDVTDTKLGILARDGAISVNISATLVAEQVD